jgi:chemotaxis protein methyltransferase CheR
MAVSLNAARAPDPAEASVEDLEIALLLEGVYRHYGLDFREWAQGSLKRRLLLRVRDEGLATISALQDRVLHDPDCRDRLVGALAVKFTSMFRDPEFYVVFRNEVVPLLRTYPFVRIWHAGCSTGEEVYSLAILLREEGIYERCRIYATDLDDGVLRRAAAGRFPLGGMRENTANYLRADFRTPFSEYYVTRGDEAHFDPNLSKNVVFARHNLASDASFNEFNVILCRNVMIYFTQSLQDRVHRLMYDSLAMFGYLGLGRRETPQFSPFESRYRAVDSHVRLYRKMC